MMKRTAAVFLVLIIGIPLTNAAYNVEDTDQIPTMNNEQNTFSLTDQPDWATHQFIAVIGMTNLRGWPLRPTHTVLGYCTESFSDTFVGVVVERNQTEPSGYLGGKVMGPFFIGRISTGGSNEKGMNLVGIGVSNETHFYYRFMGLRGPALYLTGRYQPIEIKTD